MDNVKPDIQKPWSRTRLIVNLDGQESKVDDSFGNDTDINNIVARFQRTGSLPEPPPGETQFCDVTGLQDDLTAIIERGREAQAEIDRLTAEHKLQQELDAKAKHDELQSKLEKLARYEAADQAAP